MISACGPAMRQMEWSEAGGENFDGDTGRLLASSLSSSPHRASWPQHNNNNNSNRPEQCPLRGHRNYLIGRGPLIVPSRICVASIARGVVNGALLLPRPALKHVMIAVA